MVWSSRFVCWSVALGVATHGLADDAPSRAATALDWGIYQIYWSGPKYRSVLEDQIAKLATRPAYVMFYRDLLRPFPKTGVDAIHSLGATPIVSLELWRWHDRKTKYLPAIVGGEYDAFFREWAREAKEDGRRVLLRFGFEFNGDWFTWGGDPQTFVRAWRRAHRIFDDVGASNVEWVWCANVTSHPSVPANDMRHYYAGDAYVAWVAVDGYNWGDHYREWHQWKMFDELFAEVLRSFAERYPSKRAMVAEFGCPEGSVGQKAAWIRGAHASARRWPQLQALIWFNFDKRREGELNFRIDSTAESLRAFNTSFAAKRPSDRP